MRHTGHAHGERALGCAGCYPTLRQRAREWLPHFTLDTTHLLVGWWKDGWKGPSLQWEFGAYVNFDLAISEKHDYRWTYNYPAWRHDTKVRYGKEPLPRFQFKGAP